MATLRRIGTKVEAQVEFIINERQLAALDALFGYNMDAFFEVFYKNMGRAYLEPFEKDLRELAGKLCGCASLGGDIEECRQFLSLTNEERHNLLRRGFEDRRRSFEKSRGA